MIKKLSKIIFSALILVALIFAAAGLAGCAEGNGSKYSLSNIHAKQTALTGKTIYWLGSSVTVGMESNNVAVADYIAARNGSTCVKEAVSGTTLKDGKKNSYVSRLENTGKFDKSAKIDAFVCQISTNDAKSSIIPDWGELTGDTVVSGFDKQTTLGAMEYIVTYVEKTWNCPVYFYSGAHFGDSGARSSKNPKGSDYAKLVEQTHKLAGKWNKIEGYEVKVIDLFNDEDFNNVTDEQYKLYMHDAIHPFKAGYLEWWTPVFEEAFFGDFGA